MVGPVWWWITALVLACYFPVSRFHSCTALNIPLNDFMYCIGCNCFLFHCEYCVNEIVSHKLLRENYTLTQQQFPLTKMLYQVEARRVS